MIDQFFDCLNVTNLVTGKHKRKAFQDPYTASKDDPSKEDFRLKVNISMQPYTHAHISSWVAYNLQTPQLHIIDVT